MVAEKTVVCGRCQTVSPVLPVEGMPVDLPEKWAALAMLTRPTIHMLLCPMCSSFVRTVLTVEGLTTITTARYAALIECEDEAHAHQLAQKPVAVADAHE